MADNSFFGILRSVLEAPHLISGKQRRATDQDSPILNTLQDVGTLVSTLQGKGNQIQAFEQQEQQQALQEQARKAKEVENAVKFVNQDALAVTTKEPFQALLEQIKPTDEASAKLAQAQFAGGQTKQALQTAQSSLNRISAEGRRQDAKLISASKDAIRDIKDSRDPEAEARNIISKLPSGLSKSNFRLKAGPQLKKLKFMDKDINQLFKTYKADRQANIPGPITPQTPNASIELENQAVDAIKAIRQKVKLKQLKGRDVQAAADALESLNSEDPEERQDAQQLLILINNAK